MTFRNRQSRRNFRLTQISAVLGFSIIIALITGLLFLELLFADVGVRVLFFMAVLAVFTCCGFLSLILAFTGFIPLTIGMAYLYMLPFLLVSWSADLGYGIFALIFGAVIHLPIFGWFAWQSFHTSDAWS